MTKKKTILVTGVTSYWGAKVAEHLLAKNDLLEDISEDTGSEEFRGYHIIGLDSNTPAEQNKSLDFIQADIRNSLLVNLLKSEDVHTIVHLAFQENDSPNERAFDYNVIGTMRLLGAAAEAGVRKVIIRSSTTVYGANPANPAFLMEQHPLTGAKSNGTIRNLVEIEAFCNGFRRQVPEMVLTVLRFPGIIGASVDSPMMRFLRLNPTPVLLGFDPLMQVIHENDVIGAIIYSIDNDIPNVINVAAEGILPLAKILGLAGKLPLPIFHLCAYWGTDLMKVAGLKSNQFFPIELDYLRYPWVADLTRMRKEMGFVPTYTAEETLREFGGQLRIQRYKTQPPDLAFDEERLRDTLERRRRMRERRVNLSTKADSENE